MDYSNGSVGSASCQTTALDNDSTNMPGQNALGTETSEVCERRLANSPAGADSGSLRVCTVKLGRVANGGKSFDSYFVWKVSA